MKTITMGSTFASRKALVFLSSSGTINALDLTHPGIVWGNWPTVMIDRIEILFRTSLYLLLALSSVSIGLAEGSLFPHMLTLPLIALVYFYFDAHPLLKAESLLTNLLGLAALIVAYIEFRQGSVNVEMRILSASHLLAYFTWVVLLVKKKNQQYWWLLALSVLNMSISASLTNSYVLGLAVLLYLFMGVGTLTLFTIYRGTASVRNLQKRNPQQVSSTAAEKIARTPAIELMDGNPVSKVRGGFYLDPSERWIGVRFLGVISFISVASIIVGMGLFLITPRVVIGKWRLPSSSDEQGFALPFGKAVSGFTKEVKLGDIGEILQSSTPVMRVQFTDFVTDEVIHSNDFAERMHLDELLFRGTALGIYNKGSWAAGSRYLSSTLYSSRHQSDRSRIRQSYELEPVGCNTLFVCYPVETGRLLGRNRSSITIPQNSVTGELTFPDQNQLPGKVIRYEVISVPPPTGSSSDIPAIRMRDEQVYVTDSRNVRRRDHLGFQKVLNTISRSLESEYQQGKDVFRRRTDFSRFTYQSQLSPSRVLTYDVYLRSLLKIDRTRLSKLVETARKVCDQGSGDTTPIDRVRLIRNYLRDSGEFRYTLDLSITDPSIDPIEDFLFNRKAGHCEYFASAMTLMLRAVGVPARLVTGFSAGQWDEKSQRLLIEQRHAHAWTEAFVNGRWLVVDATPPSYSQQQNSLTASAFSWKAIQGKLSSFWQSYVLGISLARQEESIYTPLGERVRAAYLNAKSLTDSLLPESASQSRSGGETLRVVLSILVLFLPIILPIVLFVLFYYRRQLYSQLKKILPSRTSQRRKKIMLLFFRQFLDLAAKHGLRKRPEQTAREFSQLFTETFGGQLNTVALQQLPDLLTKSYYQARFRGNKLSEQEIDHWKREIDKLAQAMSRQQSR